MNYTIEIILGLILLSFIVYGGGSKFEKTNNGEVLMLDQCINKD